MAEPDNNDAVRTVKDAGKFLGVSSSQIYRLAKDGKLDLVKFGRRSTRVTQASLNRFVQSAERVVPKRK
jgi:excisionase family DNA binding protein